MAELAANPAASRPVRASRGRLVVWALFALLLCALPWMFRSSLALSMLSQMGYLAIICLSYNILLGQGGMLSFGHAVYTGLGAFLALHAMNLATKGTIWLPVAAVPIVGGLAGMGFSLLFGYVTTKKSGTTFAMITLGIGELVAAMSLMFPGFFGGEGGITTNRTYGSHPLGFTYGPQIQVYYLIAAYCFVCTALMYAFTGTPLGRMLNAVRDNPERVEFIGYDTQWVRYLGFVIAGFFAGVGGALSAINFEIVNASDGLSTVRSGGYLLFTFLGGATFFFGPMIGAVLLVLASVLLSEVTKAWLLYLGLVFLLMVMYAPGGIASLVMMNLRVAKFGKFARVAPWYALLLVAALPMALGIGALIEMVYHVQLNEAQGPTLHFLGVELNVKSALSWLGAGMLALVGGALFEAARRIFARHWGEVQGEIEAAIRAKEGGA
ncbi:MAG: branched-chain amino acid ABC transporter permease [Caldimonas sp.]